MIDQDNMNPKEGMSEKTKKLYDALGVYPGIRKLTAETKTVRELLLSTDGQTLLNGKLWDIHTSNMGAGVYKVWLALFTKKQSP